MNAFGIGAVPADNHPEPPVEELEADILRVKPRQVSRNGNEYTLIETSFGTQVFVGQPAWRREVEQNIGLYYFMDARLFVRDRTPDEEETGYRLVFPRIQLHGTDDPQFEYMFEYATETPRKIVEIDQDFLAFILTAYADRFDLSLEETARLGINHAGSEDMSWGR